MSVLVILPLRPRVSSAPLKSLVPFLESQVQGLHLVPTILEVLVVLFQNLSCFSFVGEGQHGWVSRASSDWLHAFLSDAGETRAHVVLWSPVIKWQCPLALPLAFCGHLVRCFTIQAQWPLAAILGSASRTRLFYLAFSWDPASRLSGLTL